MGTVCLTGQARAETRKSRLLEHCKILRTAKQRGNEERLSSSDGKSGREAPLFLRRYCKKGSLTSRTPRHQPWRTSRTKRIALFFASRRIASRGRARAGIASASVASRASSNGVDHNDRFFGHDDRRVCIFIVGRAIPAGSEPGSDSCYAGELEKFFHSGMN